MCVRYVCCLGGSWQTMWQVLTGTRHVGTLRQYPMNLAPFEKSCEPLIKELLSQRSIPLPDNIQEAIYCSAKMFFLHVSVVAYVIYMQ